MTKRNVGGHEILSEIWMSGDMDYLNRYGGSTIFSLSHVKEIMTILVLIRFAHSAAESDLD